MGVGDRDAKVALVLMNLGSPDSTDVKDVRKYLREFLMDERVIDYPYLFRWMLVNGIIAPLRAPKSAKAYESIWTQEGSPLIVLTEQLKEELDNVLDIPVRVMMRYGSPTPKSVYDELNNEYPHLERVILLPLYPHYAMSSYETAVVHALNAHKSNRYLFNVEVVKPFYNKDVYIDALAESIRPFIEQEYDHILFSYHGVPERHIYKGDITGGHCLKSAGCCTTDSKAHSQCYRHQCFATTQLVADRLNIPSSKYGQSFQSRLGREEWLKPYTAEQLALLPSKGIKKLLVVCPAFVSDCLETLEEIAEEGKEIFIHAGGKEFTMIPCLNTHPLWIRAITQWANENIDGSKQMTT